MTMTPTSSRQYPERSFSVDDFIQSSEKLQQHSQESNLSEAELRQLYDQEEIARFLRLFSAYVKEVRLSEVPPTESASQQQVEDAETWATVQDPSRRVSVSSTTSNEHPLSSSTLSEEITNRYISPLLPGSRSSIPEFSYGRLRLALERMYLFVLPIYLPLFYNLMALATWEDRFTSSTYCTIYWTLWWYNLLVPALIVRILFSLLRRKIWLYPSLEELKAHRMEIDEADKFSKMMDKASTSSVVTEVWRLFRLADNTMNLTRRVYAKGGKEKHTVNDAKSAAGDVVTSQEEGDLLRYGLFLLDEIVDLHERIRNIFIWRKPSSSLRYAIALSTLFFISFLPAQYLAKLTFFGIGFLFWHVTPIIAALPDKKRIPSPFSDVPTDAEYAMSLISERVAAGLEINPGKIGKKDSPSKQSNLSEKATESIKNTFRSGTPDIKKLLSGKGSPVPEKWPSIHSLLTTAISIAQPQTRMETYTYPCQHSSGPGLITLTNTAMFFTPLMSQNAKFVVPLSAVKAVKKAGVLKGLNVRWTHPSDENQGPKDEKFHWIGNRDEVFARLIGVEGRKWVKV